MSTSDQKLAAIAAILSDATATSPTPGPGIAPTPNVPANWHRNPGEPLPANPPTCYDDIPTALRYAANGDNTSGIKVAKDADLSSRLTLADFLKASTTTAAQRESKLVGAGNDADAAVYQLLTNAVTGWPTGIMGAAKLMYPNAHIADLVHKPGQPIGGNVAGF